MEPIENENSIPNSKKIMAPSSLKNNKFKGLTSEQIIKKYENVLFSREKQFYELSNEITKLTQKIQNLMKKKEKSKYNNDLLKDIFSQKQQILKQELSNKEIVFMKLTDLEHKYDDLQNKIDYIINKQNALADSTQKEKEKMIQDKEEGKKLIDKEYNNEMKEENTINTINISQNELNKENNIEDEKKDIEEEIKEENNNNNINININDDNSNELINKENKPNINLIDMNENIIENKKENEIKKSENQDKKENSFSLARERLNKLKREKNEKIKKLNLFDLVNQNQTNENNNENNNS